MWSPEHSQLSKKKTVGPFPSSKAHLLGKPGAGRPLQPAALSALGSLVFSHADECGNIYGIQSGKGIWINTWSVCSGLTVRVMFTECSAQHGWCRSWCTVDAFVHACLVSSKSLSTSHLNKAQSGVLDGTVSGFPHFWDVQPLIKEQSLTRLSSDCPVVLCFPPLSSRCLIPL